MYGKAFESMYSGSLVGSGLNVWAVWNYVITMTHHGVIELNPKLLAAILGGTVKEIESAIEFLCKADPESRCKDEEGKRLIREGQYQYRVVTWAYYQQVKDAEALRQYNRERQREYRAKQREANRPKNGKPLPGERSSVEAYKRGDDAECDRLAEIPLNQLHT